MEEELNYYILFETYTQGMILQEMLKKNGLKSRIAPTPRSIQGELGCGMSLLVLPENIEAAKACIDQNEGEYYDSISLPCQIKPDRLLTPASLY